MKSRIAVLTLAVVAALLQTANIQAQATNPPYLSQFPSVERVKAEVKGTDPVDTAARQQEAFWLLMWMIRDLAGQRYDNDEMTRAEEALESKYGEAFQWYQYKERAPSPQDQPRWNKLLEFYEKDPGFLDDLLKRFFTPELRAGYYRTTKKQPPGSTQNARTAPSPSGAATTTANLGLPAEPTAVLLVANDFQNPKAVKALTGMPLWLLNDSFASLLQKTKLLDGPPGATAKVTPLRTWAASCLTGSPVCQGMLYEVQGNIVGASKMEATGRATFPAVPPGSYYVLALTADNRQPIVWDLRVDLKPGANSITLGQNNVARLDIRTPQTTSSSIATSKGGGAAARPENVPAAPARPSGPSNSVLSLRALSESRQPIGRTTFYLLDDDFESILTRAGFTPQMLLGKQLPLLSSFEVVRRWKTLKETNPAFSLFEGLTGESAALPPDVEERYAIGMRALSEHAVATIKTDIYGRASFPSVPAGTYYVYGTSNEFVKTGATGTVTGNTVTLNDTGYQQATIWNLKVAVKPGQNPVTLTPDNAASAGS